MANEKLNRSTAFLHKISTVRPDFSPSIRLTKADSRIWLTYELQSLLPTTQIGNEKWYIVTEPIEVFALTKRSISHTSASVVITKTCEITDQKEIMIHYDTRVYSKRAERNSHGTVNATTTILEKIEQLDGSYFVSEAYITSVKLSKTEQIRFRATEPSSDICLLASGLEIENKKLLVMSCYPPFNFQKIARDDEPPKQVVIALDHQTRTCM
jgi:hypothetical protein